MEDPDKILSGSSSSVVVEEPQYCPEAVVNWYSLGLEKRKRSDTGHKTSELKSKARKHLLAMKWVFWYGEKGERKELRYTSPKGKVYYSLRTACKACMDEEAPSPKTASWGKRSCSESESSDVVFKSRKKRKREKRLNAEQPKSRKVLRTVMKLRDDQKGIEPTPVGSSSCSSRVVLSRLIQNNVVVMGSHVRYRGGKSTGGWLAEGWISSNGINCKCCGQLFTISKFEVHAGSKNHRPGPNIVLDDGRSLLDCQREMMMSNNKLASPKGQEIDNKIDNFDVCCICRYGGELILCDLCPYTFHTRCLGLKDVPSGEWFCPSCCCLICGEAKYEKTVEHSVDDDDIVCSCDQCEHKFHMGCLRSQRAVKVKNYAADDKWFCSDECEHIFSGLHKLSGRPISLGVDNLTWRLLKCDPEDPNVKVLTKNQRKLNVAVDVMHECFEPAMDPLTGGDIVENVIFNRRSKKKHKNFQGFYTVVLESKREIVSVATVRVFQDVAEIPLVATRFKFRGKGMCRRLMDELEKQLASLGVMKLILPAAPNVLETWTMKFGFSKMTDSERLKYLSYNFLDFQDTIMCQKLLMKKPSANLCTSEATWSRNAGADVKSGSACSPVSVLQGQQIGEP